MIRLPLTMTAGNRPGYTVNHPRAPHVMAHGDWPTIEEIDAALWPSLYKPGAVPTEVFDFGVIEDALLKRESLRAAPLLVKGLLDLPFPRVMYRYRFLPDAETQGETLELMSDDGHYTAQPFVTVIHRRPLGWRATDLSCIPPTIVTKYKLPHELGHRWEVAASATVTAGTNPLTGQPQWKTVGDRYTDTEHIPANMQLDATDRLLGGLADTITGLTLILSARGVPRRVEHPPERLNAKRAKNGRPPLPRVTYVDARYYTDAARRTDHGGTHASPVPHLRRGHPRRLHSGRETWVRDCIVNATSVHDIERRDHYEIETTAK